ncbi:hypothetical protein I4131_12315 [Staphylococcus aureus]|nr:hypothetical protein [Staphylococcus aureus]
MIESKKDLEELLIKQGINERDIQVSKNLYPKYISKDEYYYYDKINTNNEINKVPVSQIHSAVSTRTLNEEYSWYDNMYLTLVGQAHKYNINLDKQRFETLLKYLKENTSDFLHLMEYAERGKNKDYIHRLTRFIDENNNITYHQGDFHAHRLVLAKVIGLKTLTCDEIVTYQYNKRKATIYNKLKMQQNSLIETINKSHIFDITKYKDSYYIKINKKSNKIDTSIYGDVDEWLSKPTVNQFNNNAKQYISVIKWLYDIEINIRCIEKTLTYEHNYFQYLPKFILVYMLKSSENIDILDIVQNHQKVLKYIKCIKAIQNK